MTSAGPKIEEPDYEQAPDLTFTVTAIRKLYEKYVAFHTAYARAQAGTMALYTLVSIR